MMGVLKNALLARLIKNLFAMMKVSNTRILCNARKVELHNLGEITDPEKAGETCVCHVTHDIKNT